MSGFKLHSPYLYRAACPKRLWPAHIFVGCNIASKHCHLRINVADCLVLSKFLHGTNPHKPIHDTNIISFPKSFLPIWKHWSLGFHIPTGEKKNETNNQWAMMQWEWWAQHQSTASTKGFPMSSSLLSGAAQQVAQNLKEKTDVWTSFFAASLFLWVVLFSTFCWPEFSFLLRSPCSSSFCFLGTVNHLVQFSHDFLVSIHIEMPSRHRKLLGFRGASLQLLRGETLETYP